MKSRLPARGKQFPSASTRTGLSDDVSSFVTMLASRAVEMVSSGNSCRSICDGEITCRGYGKDTVIARFIAEKVLQVVSSSCKPAKYYCRSVVADCAVDVVVVAVGFDGAKVAIDTDDVVGSDVELAVDADTVVGVDIDVTSTSDGLDVGMRFLVRVRLFVWRIFLHIFLCPLIKSDYFLLFFL